MLNLLIDRDSVCMADDIDSHEKKIEISNKLKLSEFIGKIIDMRYLPYIAGGKATWVLKYQNKPLAVIGFTNYGPKVTQMKIKLFVNDINLTELSNVNIDKKLGFGYYAQEDYNIVYEKLKRNK